jgi:hypothetical protein
MSCPPSISRQQPEVIDLPGRAPVCVRTRTARRQTGKILTHLGVWPAHLHSPPAGVPVAISPATGLLAACSGRSPRRRPRSPGSARRPSTGDRCHPSFALDTHVRCAGHSTRAQGDGASGGGVGPRRGLPRFRRARHLDRRAAPKSKFLRYQRHRRWCAKVAKNCMAIWQLGNPAGRGAARMRPGKNEVVSDHGGGNEPTTP